MKQTVNVNSKEICKYMWFIIYYLFYHNISVFCIHLQNLDKGQQFAWDIAKDPTNQQKNEHANIFPCMICLL